MNFKESKDLYWFEFISNAIPQDLHSLYKDDIGKIKSGFQAGVEFALKFYDLKDIKYDKQRTG